MHFTVRVVAAAVAWLFLLDDRSHRCISCDIAWGVRPSVHRDYALDPVTVLDGLGANEDTSVRVYSRNVQRLLR